MKFIVRGIDYPWDHQRLTLREARDAEKATGVPINDLLRDFNGRKHETGARGMDGYAAFLWVAMRRSDPAVKFEDVLDLDVSEVDENWDDEITPAADEVTDETPPVAPAATTRGSARRPAATSTKK